MNLESPHYCIHSAFGLRFRSQLEWLPIPRTEDSDFEVDVTCGSVPTQLEKPLEKNDRFEAQLDELLFKTKTIANFWVKAGHHIRFSPKPCIDNLRLCNLLFGAVAGGVLIQRKIVALHGCSIETPNGAVIICGNSGAGKSTLSTLLLKRGFRILDDNIAALDDRSDHYCVHPGLGFVRLTEGTLKLLKMNPPTLSFPSPVQPKYLHFLPSSGFCDQSCPLQHIYLLDRSNDTFLTPVVGPAKLDALCKFTYVTHMIAGLGQVEAYFSQWLKLANTVPISIIGQPSHLTTRSWADQIATLLTC